MKILNRVKLYAVFFIFVSIAAYLFISCEKPNTDDEDKITDKYWYLYDQRMVSPDTSVFKYLDSCYRDDTFYFYYDGVLEINEGKKKCDAQAPTIQRVTWSFSEDKHSLNVTDYRNEKTVYKIIDLKAIQLILQGTTPYDNMYKFYYKPKTTN